MKATKLIAFMAVMVMLVAPITAVVACDQNSQGAIAWKNETATHIAIDDLDEKELKELFDITIPESNSDLTMSLKEVFIIKAALAVLVPGLNLEGLSDPDLKSIKLSGVDLEFDYARSNNGDTLNGVVALRINVDSFSFTFNKTHQGMYMLSSDALKAWLNYGEATLPASYLAQWSEIGEDALKQLNDDITTLSKLKAGATPAAQAEVEKELSKWIGTGESYIAQNWDDLYSWETKFGPQTVMTLVEKAEVMALYEAYEEAAEAEKQAAQQAIIDYLNNWVSGESGTQNVAKIILAGADYYIPRNQFRTMLGVYDIIQSLVANGDYANGLEAAYGGKTFTGDSLTLSGSAHVTLYLESKLVTKLIDKCDMGDGTFQKVIQNDYKMYAIMESGLNIGTILKNVPSIVWEQIGEKIDSKKLRMVEVIGTGIPINELRLDLGLNTIVDHAGNKAMFTTGVAFDFVCDLIYQYNDVYALFDRSRDQGMTIKAKELSATIKGGSYITHDGVKYSNGGFSVIDENDLKKIVDGMQGTAWYYTGEWDLDEKGQLVKRADRDYMSPYAFIVDPINGDYESTYANFMVSPVLGYDICLNVFKYLSAMQVSSDSLNATSEADAERLITKFGGECTHDVGKTVDSVKELYDSMYEVTEKKSDNSMTILWIVLAIVLILAVIGFAAVLYKRKA